MSTTEVVIPPANMSGAQVLQKINTMVSSNITIIFILVILIVVLGIGMFYFTRSLIKTLNNYYRNRIVVDTSGGDSLKDKSADNEDYPDPADPDSKEDDELKAVIDPSNFMAKGKRDFLTNLKIENKEYNKEKTEFVTRRLNYSTNDDIVDDKIMYKDYDNYDYTVQEE